MAATVSHRQSLPPVVNNNKRANSTSTVPSSRRVPPPSYLNTTNKSTNNRAEAKRQTTPTLTQHSQHLTSMMEANLFLLHRPVEPEFENPLGNPGKFPNIIMGRLVAWASHRDRISNVQPKIDTWKDMNSEDAFRKQKREAWYRDRLRGLEEIARKNSYANRLLAAVKPSFNNRLTSGDERMRKVVIGNKLAHKDDAFRLQRIQYENEQMKNRLLHARTSFDLKKMETDFQLYMKHRSDRVEHRKRQEQREIDEFIRSRSSSCMSNRSSDRGSVRSTMTANSRFVKRKGKWPGMLHERTVSDECLALTRPPPTRGRRRTTPAPPSISSTRKSKVNGSTDNLATNRSQRSNGSQQSLSATTARDRTNKPGKTVKLPPGSASSNGSKSVPPIKKQQREPSRVYGSQADVGDSDTLVRRSKLAPTPRDQPSRNSGIYGGPAAAQRRKRDSSVDSSVPSSVRRQPTKPLPPAKTQSRASQLSSQSTASRASVVSKQQPHQPEKSKQEEKGELLAILLQTAPAPMVERESTPEAAKIKQQQVRKPSAESNASNAASTKSAEKPVMQPPAYEEPTTRYVGSSSPSETSQKLRAVQKGQDSDDEAQAKKPTAAKPAATRVDSAGSSASGVSVVKAVEPEKKPQSVTERQASGRSSHLSSDAGHHTDDKKPAAVATVGWAQKAQARPDSGSSFFSDIAKPNEAEPVGAAKPASAKSNQSAAAASIKQDSKNEVALEQNNRVASATSTLSDVSQVAKPVDNQGDREGSGKSKQSVGSAHSVPKAAPQTPPKPNVTTKDSSSEESGDEKPKASGWGVKRVANSSSSSEDEAAKPLVAKAIERQQSAQSNQKVVTPPAPAASTQEHQLAPSKTAQPSDSSSEEEDVKPKGWGIKSSKKDSSSSESEDGAAPVTRPAAVEQKASSPSEKERSMSISSKPAEMPLSGAIKDQDRASKAETISNNQKAPSITNLSKEPTVESLKPQPQAPMPDRQNSSHSSKSLVPSIAVTDQDNQKEEAEESKENPTENVLSMKYEREPSIASTASSSIASSRMSVKAPSVKSMQSKRSVVPAGASPAVQRKASIASTLSKPGTNSIAERHESLNSKKSLSLAPGKTPEPSLKLVKSDSVSSGVQKQGTSRSPSVLSTNKEPQRLARQDTTQSKQSTASAVSPVIEQAVPVAKPSSPTSSSKSSSKQQAADSDVLVLRQETSVSEAPSSQQQGERSMHSQHSAVREKSASESEGEQNEKADTVQPLVKAGTSASEFEAEPTAKAAPGMYDRLSTRSSTVVSQPATEVSLQKDDTLLSMDGTQPAGKISGKSSASTTIAEAAIEAAKAAEILPMNPKIKTFKEEEESSSEEEAAKPSGWGKPKRPESSNSSSSTEQQTSGNKQGQSSSPASNKATLHSPPALVIIAPTPGADQLKTPQKEEAESEGSVGGDEESVKGFGKKQNLEALSGRSSPSASSEKATSGEKKPASNTRESLTSTSSEESEARPSSSNIQLPQKVVRPGSATSESRRSALSRNQQEAQAQAARVASSASSTSSEKPNAEVNYGRQARGLEKSPTSSAGSTKSAARQQAGFEADSSSVESTPRALDDPGVGVEAAPIKKTPSPVRESTLEDEPEVIVTTVSSNRPTIQKTARDTDDSSVASTTSSSTDTTPRNSVSNYRTNYAAVAATTNLSMQKEESTVSGNAPTKVNRPPSSSSSTGSSTHGGNNIQHLQPSQLDLTKASIETASSVDTPKAPVIAVDIKRPSSSGTNMTKATTEQEDNDDTSSEEESVALRHNTGLI